MLTLADPRNTHDRGLVLGFRISLFSVTVINPPFTSAILRILDVLGSGP